MSKKKSPSKDDVERAIADELPRHSDSTSVKQKRDGKRTTRASKPSPKVTTDEAEGEVIDALTDTSFVEVEIGDEGERIIRSVQSGQIDEKDGKIRNTKDNLQNETTLKDKRIYRRKGSDELDDASRSPRAEINRITQLVSVRVSREHRATFEAVSARFGSKREALEHAIDLLEERFGPQSDTDPDLEP